jgi:hypothetical protein
MSNFKDKLSALMTLSANAVRDEANCIECPSWCSELDTFRTKMEESASIRDRSMKAVIEEYDPDSKIRSPSSIEDYINHYAHQMETSYDEVVIKLNNIDEYNLRQDLRKQLGITMKELWNFLENATENDE